MSALFSGPQDTPGEVKQAGVSCLPASLPLPSDQLAYSCFSLLMKRMSQNFPNGGAMDIHFANMRSLIQVRSAAAPRQVTVAAGLVHPRGGQEVLASSVVDDEIKHSENNIKSKKSFSQGDG